MAEIAYWGVWIGLMAWAFGAIFFDRYKVSDDPAEVLNRIRLQHEELKQQEPEPVPPEQDERPEQETEREEHQLVHEAYLPIGALTRS